MKKVLFSVLISLLAIFMTVCCSACKKTYNLKYGAYGFEKVYLTDKLTKEVTEKDYYDIMLAEVDEFKLWCNLFNFQIIIDEDTEYIYKKDNRCFVLNEGLAFEVIGENKLQLHFPYWNDYNLNNYDVVIILGWQQLYG